jgi:uncharacterized protein YbbK (DUF523 family)
VYKRRMLIISSCLVGICSTYQGSSHPTNAFSALLREGRAIPVCPEQLGGLPTPRLPSEIVGGTGDDVLDGRARVLMNDGTDVTQNYLRGAHEVLRIAQIAAADTAILKERSPSCGVHEIYDGSFSRCVIAGRGVTTALLVRNGIRVLNEQEGRALASL